MCRFIVGLLFTLISSTGLSWNKHSHSLIGEIAYLQMTETARKKVDAHLNTLHEEYSDYDWQENGNSLLSGFSYWADWFRSNKGSFFYDYHFMSTPIYIGHAYPLTIPDNAEQLDGTMVNEILRIEKILSNKHTDAITPFFLAKYIHMVQDIHMPLHATDRYHEKYFPQGDRGGNDLTVRKPTPQAGKINLHSYWDSALEHYKQRNIDLRQLAIDAKQLQQQCIQNHINTLVNELDAITWWHESMQIALHHAYLDEHKGKVQEIFPDHHLTSSYLEKNQPIAIQRIVLAGCRLGKKLNVIFDQ